MKENKELVKLREQIDKIDRDLLNLLKKRFGVIRKISKVKIEQNLPITDIKREREIIDRLDKMNNSIDPHLIEDLFQVIFRYSKINQSYKKKNPKIM